MNDQTGPQPGQGHPWSPQQGQPADQQGRPQGTPTDPSGQSAPGHAAPGQPTPGRPAPGQQQPGPWGSQGGQHPYGGPHQGGYGQPAAPPQQGGTFGQPQGGHGSSGPQGQQPGAASAATPVSGSSGMATGDVVRIVLHVLALLLVVIGISLDMDGRDSVLWSDTWTWAGFATLMALAQGAALLPKTALSGVGWTIGAVGAGGLLLFWTLLMLPTISTNMAFLVTLGTACATAGVLLSPDRKL